MTNDVPVQGVETGTIYVLRSKSEHPTFIEHCDLIHRIGVTGGDVVARIGDARADPTLLFAEVEIVATYKLFNNNRVKLENVLHRAFIAVRLDPEIKGRFGKPVKPREWHLAPLPAIDEAVKRVRDGSIIEYHYDPAVAQFVRR